MSDHSPLRVVAPEFNRTSKIPEPYRIFFPLGIFMGLWGVSYWPLYAIGFLETIPLAQHIDIQIQGFLFAFILVVPKSPLDPKGLQKYETPLLYFLALSKRFLLSLFLAVLFCHAVVTHFS